MEMWVDLDETCVQLASVHFCGGQHLDHITAYSADGLPVLELCRRSDAQRVIAFAIGTHHINLWLNLYLINDCKPESLPNLNRD